MYLFESEATFEADPATVWKVWTDVGRWPEWDVSKEIARLDGPFEPGVTGWAKQRGNLGGSFTITMVDSSAPAPRALSTRPQPPAPIVSTAITGPRMFQTPMLTALKTAKARVTDQIHGLELK